MVRLTLAPVLLAGLPVVFSALVQKPDLALPESASAHRDEVVKIFKESYEAYREFAWGHDDLAPVSQGFINSRNGWGASVIDALATMKIIGLEELFLEGVDFAGTIDFSRSKVEGDVSVFETTIRYLGGFLSAYELDDFKNPILLQKAQEVADKMAFAWHEGSPIPHPWMDFATDTPDGRNSNIAEAGTLALEWLTLSKYTKNETYGELAVNALKHIANLTPPLPGLAAQGLNPTTGQFVGGYVSWGGASDSYFEYLIKYARLTNTDDPLFTKSWLTAIDSSIKHLLHKSSVGDHVYLGDWQNGKLIPVSSHLACFHGGNWLLGGKLTNNDTIVKHGLDLVDSCWNTYASTATGIGPEVFRWFPEGTNATISGADLEFYNEHGFYMTGKGYIHRPEVLESNFMAWRVTGDTKYLDRAASAIESFNKYMTSPDFKGYAALRNVDDENTEFVDHMESFWFAEVLKYLYLTFDDPAHISLDEWVFTTEAQPLKAPPPKDVYSDGSIFSADNWFAPFTSTDGPLPVISPIPGVENPFTAHRQG